MTPWSWLVTGLWSWHHGLSHFSHATCRRMLENAGECRRIFRIIGNSGCFFFQGGFNNSILSCSRDSSKIAFVRLHLDFTGLQPCERKILWHLFVQRQRSTPWNRGVLESFRLISLSFPLCTKSREEGPQPRDISLLLALCKKSSGTTDNGYIAKCTLLAAARSL